MRNFKCEIVEISHMSVWCVDNLSSNQTYNTYRSFLEKDISGTWGSVISLSVTIKRKCNYKCGALQASAPVHEEVCTLDTSVYIPRKTVYGTLARVHFLLNVLVSTLLYLCIYTTAYVHTYTFTLTRYTNSLF